MRIPAPPTMKNHHNYVASLSQLGRWLGEEAEAVGATILPETSATKLLVEHGRVRGVRTGDRGRGRDGEQLANFEPGSDIVARVTVLCEGTQGHLTGAAIERFGLAGENPQVWALGVKEVWKVPRPLDRVIHTMGWPLRTSARYREFGGSFIYPLGDDMVSLGMVVGLDYRDAELSVHDLLQELKTHPLVRRILEGGERVEWGAKTIPGGRLRRAAEAASRAGRSALRRRRGARERAGAQGHPLRGRVGAARGRGGVRARAAGGEPGDGAWRRTTTALRESFVWKDLQEVRNMRQAFGRGFWLGGAMAGAMTATKGHFPPGNTRTERDAEQELISSRRARASYPAPDGKLTFDKLSSVFASGNKTRDDQPNHIRVQTRVPRGARADVGAHVPGAGVRVDGRRGAGDARRTASSAARSRAKGGRLTPPEGGSGPEYRLT